MQPRTFQAKEINEALALVRRELGPDAVILETRQVPGRALGLLGGSLIEVTASGPEGDDETAPEAPATPAARTAAARGKSMLAYHRANRAREAPAPTVQDQIRGRPDDAIAAASGKSSRVFPHAALRRRLLAGLVPRDLCERWLAALPAPSSTDPLARADSEGLLRAQLHEQLGAPVPLLQSGSRVAAFVGPTGVGKTTTIAKLSAQAKLLDGKRVAIVNLDDQRLGGAIHLRAFARTLDVEVVHVDRNENLAHALASLRDVDIVFIDTSGLSAGRPQAFGEISQRLRRAGEPVSVHLCVSASTRQEELDRILHLAAGLQTHALIATKLDEAVAAGSMFAARMHTKTPFSFVTTGQVIPDDIAPASAAFLIDLLLGGARA